MYCCSYHGEYFSTFSEFKQHYNTSHISDFPTMFQLGLKYYIWHWIMIVYAAITMLLHWIHSKDEIVVTNRNVYGKKVFGKTLILPIYQISAVFNARIFSRIAIVTSRGIIRFFWIDNHRLIAVEIRNLINQRQANTEISGLENNFKPNTYVEELEKLKTLFDNGVITQEEFDAKKKQLLGI